MGGVQFYTIFGRQVGSHYALVEEKQRNHQLTTIIVQLAIGVLGSLAAIPALRSFGSSKKTPAAPPINASSPDEADFIKKFLESGGAPDRKEVKEAAQH